MSESNPHKTSKKQDEFLTARQVAAILQVSQATVRRLAQTGRIPSIRLTSRLLRFHLPTVRAALDAEAKRSRRPQPDEEPTDDGQLSFADLPEPNSFQ
jgi:excisionase family DNA binding protein